MAAQNRNTTATIDDVVRFVRKRDYKLVRELGQGACGKTVLLYDEQISEYFVCKKYLPYLESQRNTLFSSFVREIKLLHRVYHPNVIRVFNYYLYPDSFSGYILMEFVDGLTVEDHLRNYPEQINELFAQAISGFSYLERVGILHRDIRPGNIMVDKEGRLKIIDLGFGKHVRTPVDFEKSITLNWWCQPPGEFTEDKYDFATEIYFLGKLFERIIQDAQIDSFKFGPVLGSMCQFDPTCRVRSFVEIERTIQGSQFVDLDFNDEQMRIYRAFCDAVAGQITKIESRAKYADDPERLQTQLNDVYRRVMLERFVPDAALVLRQLLVGTFYYKKMGMPTEPIREFVRMLKALSQEQLRVLIANLHARLDAIPRYTATVADDDIPF